jgi:outer membrane protein TolC
MKFINKNYIALAICIMVVGCKAPSAESAAKTVVPEAFSTNTDTTTIASMQWRNFFTKNLQNLIDTALQNNQELQITGN